jgi:hypothetical protein
LSRFKVFRWPAPFLGEFSPPLGGADKKCSITTRIIWIIIFNYFYGRGQFASAINGTADPFTSLLFEIYLISAKAHQI